MGQLATKKSLFWYKVAFSVMVMGLVTTALNIDVTHANSINVGPDSNAITNNVKEAAGNFIGFLRGVFGFVAAAMIAWGGGIMIFGSDARKMAEAKGKFAMAIVALLIVFFADKIVAVIGGIFNIKTG